MGDFWRAGEPGGNGRAGYMAAIICRRGHVKAARLTEVPRGDQGFCVTCGAQLLARCANCGIRLRGHYFNPNVISARASEAKPFCDGCGEPHPWAGREQRIYQLENILDQEGIDEVDRVLVIDFLEKLRETPELDEKDQLRIWKSIKERAPGLVQSSGKSIAESIMTAWIKAQMGL